ncbi:hypothetical protein DV515_00001794, partial [Chloebia gouldiae]
MTDSAVAHSMKIKCLQAPGDTMKACTAEMSSIKPNIPAGAACPLMATILRAVIQEPEHSWCHHSILRKPLEHKTSCSDEVLVQRQEILRTSVNRFSTES